MLAHRRKTITSIIALALALSAAAAPASARFFNQNAHGTFVFPLQTSSTPIASTHPTNGGSSNTANTQPTIVRVTAPSGFDWGDAGIGAASGFAVSMVGLGAVLAVSQRNGRRSNRSTAQTR